jgi:hypothetical protein
MDLLTVQRGYVRYALFGAVLGLGYLVKAILFPIGFVFLIALLPFRTQRNLKLLLSAVMFAIVCAPFIIGLSASKGRFTIGDVGPVARAQTMSLYDFANLSPGKPVAASPHIQTFVGDMWSGAYPAWTEPSVRFTGHVPHIPLRQQLNKTHIVLRFYFDLFFTTLGALTCSLLILALLQSDGASFVGRFLRQTVLWMPAIAGFGAYATLRADGRFLPSFIMGAFAAVCGAFAMGKITESNTLAKYVVYAATIVLVAQAAIDTGHTVSGGSETADQEVAATLPQFGIAPGDKVSFMGNALEDHVWAHLARVEIAAEIPKDDVRTFWAATGEQKNEALREISEAGAKALLTTDVPSTAMDEGWKRIAGTQYYILELPATLPTN